MDLDTLKLIGRKQLAAHLGFTNARSFDRWRKDHDFPAPEPLPGMSLRWSVVKVACWQMEQARTSDTKPGTSVRARKTEA